jgi:hypothetical protein
MEILNTHKLQNPRNRDTESERKRITLFEEAVKIGEKELKKNHDFYFKADTPILSNMGGTFYISTKSFDRFVTDILSPLTNMIKYN